MASQVLPGVRRAIWLITTTPNWEHPLTGSERARIREVRAALLPLVGQALQRPSNPRVDAIHEDALAIASSYLPYDAHWRCDGIG
jgi:hypothetical protein